MDLKKLSLVAGEAVFENGKNNWLEAINLQIKKLENVEESLSGKVLNDLIHNNKSFKEFGLELANLHSQNFKRENGYGNVLFENATKESLVKQEIIESEESPDFETFLKEYFNQTT